MGMSKQWIWSHLLLIAVLAKIALSKVAVSGFVSSQLWAYMAVLEDRADLHLFLDTVCAKKQCFPFSLLASL